MICKEWGLSNIYHFDRYWRQIVQQCFSHWSSNNVLVNCSRMYGFTAPACLSSISSSIFIHKCKMKGGRSIEKPSNKNIAGIFSSQYIFSQIIFFITVYTFPSTCCSNVCTSHQVTVSRKFQHEIISRMFQRRVDGILN